jgi:branched-chain amino acid transport system ATP-binding protein
VTNDRFVEVKDLSKSFGGVVALDRVSFEVEPTEIKAIIGPNGAGKTTLFNLLAGVYPPTGGEMKLKGRLLNSIAPHNRAGIGIARTFQQVELFGNMSVLENVMVGCHCKTKSGYFDAAFRSPRLVKEEKEIRQRAAKSLDMVGLSDKANEEALGLPFGQQRLLAIARALVTEPRLLLLDEPGAGLNAIETDHLDSLIRDIRERDVTILLVEHDMDLVMGLADRIVVLNYGQKIAEGTAAEIQSDEKVITAYLGGEII